MDHFIFDKTYAPFFSLRHDFRHLQLKHKIRIIKMNNFSIPATNWSNNSKEHVICSISESDVEKNAKRLAYVLLSVLGIFGNIFVIILAAKCTVPKKLHHLITSMAVSDALFLLARLLDGIPWLSHYEWTMYPSGTLGDVILITTTFLLLVSYRVSLITLLVISIERFRATRQTMQRGQPSTLKQRAVVVGLCWLIPMVVAPSEIFHAIAMRGSIPPRFVFRLVQIVPKGSSIIVCCVIFILNILTTRRLSRPQAIQSHLSEEQRKLRARRTRAAIRMVLVSVLLYLFCWIFLFSAQFNLYHSGPLDLSVGIKDVDLFCTEKSFKIFFIFAYTFLPAVNSCLSPCIYIGFLPDFREASKRLLFRRKPTRVNQQLQNRSSTDGGQVMSNREGRMPEIGRN